MSQRVASDSSLISCIAAPLRTASQSTPTSFAARQNKHRCSAHHSFSLHLSNFPTVFPIRSFPTTSHNSRTFIFYSLFTSRPILSLTLLIFARFGHGLLCRNAFSLRHARFFLYKLPRSIHAPTFSAGSI